MSCSTNMPSDWVLETGGDAYVIRLRVGQIIYRRDPNTEGPVPHTIAGFLTEEASSSTDKPILMVTGGPRVKFGTKFFSSPAMSHDRDEIGGVELYHCGVILIRLFGTVQDEVSNLLLADPRSSQWCMPVVSPDGITFQVGDRALNHIPSNRCPVKVRIRWLSKSPDASLQPRITPYHDEPLGSLITSERKGDGRQLLALGVTYRAGETGGEKFAFVAMLSVALSQLSTKKEFEGKTMNFVAPRAQCEGHGTDDTSHVASLDMQAAEEAHDSAMNTQETAASGGPQSSDVDTPTNDGEAGETEILANEGSTRLDDSIDSDYSSKA